MHRPWKVLAIFLGMALLTLAAIFALTGFLHRQWIFEMADLAGWDALFIRGYAENTGAFSDPTFSRIATVLRIAMVALPLFFGFLAALVYGRYCHSSAKLLRDTALQIDRIARGEPLLASKANILQNRLRELEFALQQKAAISEKEQNAVKALVNDISHQLKTPIAALRLNLDILDDENLSGTEGEPFREQLRQQIGRMEALVQSMIKVARLESGVIVLQPVPSDIADTLRQALREMEPKSRAKNIAVTALLPDSILLPHDPLWTREALANILDNAIKYTPKGSEIRIKTEQGASYFRIDIQDNGPGLQNGEDGLVFGRFFRGQAALASGEEGSGLGLHIAREILRRQGGSITAANAPGKGAVFTVFLQNR